MVKKLATSSYKLHVARQLLESISEEANTAYYVFASNHVPRNSSEVPDIVDDIDTVYFDSYSNMEFGKRVSANDVSLVIRNIPYESNVVYSMYDHSDDTFKTEDYYVVVNASSFYHVFKCLDNNRANTSTVEPDFAHINGANTSVYQTADGYRWKYIYSVGSSIARKFETDEWFPYTANSTVASQAVSGAIDIIRVDGEGSGYDNYSSGTFTTGAIRVDGDPLLYSLSNTSINQTNGFYTGCLLYLSSGTGSGQWVDITDSYSNGNGNFVVISEEFTIVPTNGTTWQLNPKIDISGTGRNLTNATARALVNAYSSNSVYRIEVLDRGSGYISATATVIANAVVGIEVPATIRPILAPTGGHGYDGAADLGCETIMYSVKFNNNESNTIPDSNQFQQIGLLKDPIFSNVEVYISSSNGSFISGEIVHKITPLLISTNGTMNTTSSVVTFSSADFVNQVSANEYIYLKSSDDNSHMLTRIQSVVNSSTINIASNGLFACTETLIYQANPTSNGVFISQPNTSLIYLANVEGTVSTNNIIIGNSSGGKAVVNTVYRSNVNKDFSTFIQMTKLTGTLTSGNFSNNEIIFQGTSLDDFTAKGRVYSSNIDGGTLTLYISREEGTFNTGALTGANSLATASISTVYNPEIIDGSGEILYLENLSPIQRMNNQTETIQIIFTF